MTGRAYMPRQDWTPGPRSILTKPILNEFIEALTIGMNVSEACRRLGLCRMTVYNTADRNPAFKQAWQQAELIGFSVLREDVLATARSMGVGEWIEQPILDENGEPILDDNLDPVVKTVWSTANVTPSILAKLMDKTLVGVEQPGQTVQVNVNTQATPMKLIENDEEDEYNG